MKENNTASNGKALLAILIIWILNFFFGYLIFGLALSSVYYSNTIHYPGLMKEDPKMVTLFVSTLIQSLLLIYTVYYLGRARTFGRGFIIGMIVFLLVAACTDLFVYSTMNLFNGGIVFIDSIVNALFGAVLGGIAGWFIGRTKSKPEKVELKRDTTSSTAKQGPELKREPVREKPAGSGQGDIGANI